MTPVLITETVGATFEALGWPMMSRAARLCVSACATYANNTAAASVPLGTEEHIRLGRIESERYTAVQDMHRAVTAGNILVSAGIA